MTSDDITRIDSAAGLLEQAAAVQGGLPPACARCGGSAVRWGTQHGRQRYRCRDCRRTFSETTARPVAYTKLLHLWPEHLRLMAHGRTAREAAAALDVHESTVHRWRRRTLQAVMEHEPHIGGGTVEVVRHHGLGALVALDEQGRGLLGWLYFNDGPYLYDRWLGDLFLPDSRIVVWDMPRSPVARAARRLGIPCVEVNPAAILAAERHARHARELRRLVRRAGPARWQREGAAAGPAAGPAAEPAAGPAPEPAAGPAAEPAAGAGPGAMWDPQELAAWSDAAAAAGHQSVARARRYAADLYGWLKRFRGFYRGDKAEYLAWYGELRCAATPEEFVARCIECWRPPAASTPAE